MYSTASVGLFITSKAASTIPPWNPFRMVLPAETLQLSRTQGVILKLNTCSLKLCLSTIAVTLFLLPWPQQSRLISHFELTFAVNKAVASSVRLYSSTFSSPKVFNYRFWLERGLRLQHSLCLSRNLLLPLSATPTQFSTPSSMRFMTSWFLHSIRLYCM